jgi:hypothetical protein
MDQDFFVTNLFDGIKEKFRNIPEKRANFFGNSRQFLEECGTVSVNFGRAYGHSSLAQRIMEYYFNAILFVPQEVRKRLFPEAVRKRIFSCMLGDKVFHGRDFGDKIVIVDNAVPEEFMERLCEREIGLLVKLQQ